MPTKCSHYGHLVSRFAEITEKFLDFELKAEAANPATYNPDLDKLAAFRLLFHAEVETFLEEKAKQGLNRLESDINSGLWHRKNSNIFSLYLLVKNFLQDREEISDQDVKVHYLSIIGSARGRIKDNHGIKSQSFQFLAVSFGKALDEIDATLSAILNSYGKDRGEVAHSSASRSRSLSAPSSERSSASAIVNQIAAFYDVEP